MGNNRIDITGQRFGAWTVKSFAGCDNHKQAAWNCVCDCGTERAVVSGTLRRGLSTGCGCTKKIAIRKAMTTHGASKTDTYKIWQDMIKRCKGHGDHAYKYYFSKGVKVCERWNKFENFLADMGERPTGLSIDRYPDQFGNYEPGNCRWATDSEQALNRRPRSVYPKRINGRFCK